MTTKQNQKARRQPGTEAQAPSTEVKEAPTPDPTNEAETASQVVGTQSPVEIFVEAFAKGAAGKVAEEQVVTEIRPLYEAVAGGARTNAKNSAMMRAMELKAPSERIIKLTHLIGVKASSPAKVVDPIEAAVNRLAMFKVAEACIMEALDTDDQRKQVTDTISAWGPDSVTGDRLDVILKGATKVLESANRGSSVRGTPETRRDTSADLKGKSAAQFHIETAIKSVKVGEILTTVEMAKLASPAYPEGSKRPSSGHLANFCRTLNDDGTIKGVVTGANYEGVTEPNIGAKRTK